MRKLELQLLIVFAMNNQRNCFCSNDCFNKKKMNLR